MARPEIRRTGTRWPLYQEKLMSHMKDCTCRSCLIKTARRKKLFPPVCQNLCNKAQRSNTKLPSHLPEKTQAADLFGMECSKVCLKACSGVQRHEPSRCRNIGKYDDETVDQVLHNIVPVLCKKRSGGWVRKTCHACSERRAPASAAEVLLCQTIGRRDHGVKQT